MQKLSKARLNDKIKAIEKYYNAWKHESTKEIEKILEEQKNRLDKSEYTIAVIANMSAGKSTFINALFGEDILPTADEATTDCATFIYGKSDKKEAVIYFEDNKNKVILNEKNLIEELKQYAKKDEDCSDEKYKKVKYINLNYPFSNLKIGESIKLNIIFIDTPGPNNTGTYQDKHKDQTNQVLRDADMALFLFNYRELDANLKSDEQGLWEIIRKKNELDKNFQIHFILNKIDSAFKNNFKDISPEDDNDDEKRKNFYKKNWMRLENEAKGKLEKAARKHNIDNPKIYMVSSFFTLLRRKEIKNREEKSTLEYFENTRFKDVFYDEPWEEKLIDYLGFEKLENDINSYMKNIENNIFKSIDSYLEKIKKEEKNKIEARIQQLKKPKEEVSKNLKNANAFLEKEAKTLQKKMRDAFSHIEKKYLEKIKSKIDTTIKKELESKASEIAKRSIHFVQGYATGENLYKARNQAIKMSYNEFKINLKDKELRIPIHNKEIVEKNELINQRQSFMTSLFNEYKRKYINISIDIKNIYQDFEKELISILNEYNDIFSKELEKKLDINIEKTNLKLDYDSILNFDLNISKSTIDYDFKEAEYKRINHKKWYKPLSWFKKDTFIKTKDEEHYLVFNPYELNKDIEEDIKKMVEELRKEDRDKYKGAIEKYKFNSIELFNNFKGSKQEEISRLKKDLEEKERKLEYAQEQAKEFNTITKEN